jgi:succinate-semialdehyde dehydrogenase / glutarate-semialdehyde dehydrogenase
VEAAARARLGNAGQSCVAAKRVIVLDEYFDDIVEGLGRHFASSSVGDPREPTTDLGPLASEEAAVRLAAQMADAIDQGATVITGGGRPDRTGAFVEPTVLTDVTPQMRAYNEELFGPVVVVYRATDDGEAVRLANSSPYGLSGVVFCRDLDRARAVIDGLDTGMAWINQSSGSEAGLPFGGIKRSGFGRELSHLGLLEFANRKLVRTLPPQPG